MAKRESATSWFAILTYGRYLKLKKDGLPRIDRAKLKAESRTDGRKVFASHLRRHPFRAYRCRTRALKLTVNEKKTAIRHLGEGIPLLGVVIRRRTISIQTGRLTRLKAKVKAATSRNSPVNLTKVIRDLNPVLRGFTRYTVAGAAYEARTVRFCEKAGYPVVRWILTLLDYRFELNDFLTQSG